VDKLTRKDLKKDHFAESVGHTLEELSHRRKQVTRYAVIGVVVIAVIVGAVAFYKYRTEERQKELRVLFRVLETPVLEPGQPTPGRSYATIEERTAAFDKAAKELEAKYPGSNEVAVAKYFQATDLVDKGDLNKALELLNVAVADGNTDTRGLAELAKSQVLKALGRKDEAEKSLRAVIANPGGMVMADQGTLALAELLSESKPDEALKLLEPLRTHEGSVQQLAAKLISEIRARQERASAK